MKILKQHWLFLVLVLVIFFTRLLIFNKAAAGFMADERQYKELITQLNESAAKNDYMIAVHKLFSLNARPGLGLFYYPAALMEWKNPNIPYGAYYNLIINSFCLILVYLIVKKIQGKKAAILATLIVTFSIPSVLYIRHLLSYDIALFLLALGFFVYINFKKLFIFGLFVGLSFLTYPSYFSLLPIPVILTLFHRSLKQPLIFLIGVGMVLIGAQVFSLLLGETTTYFHSLQIESGGVTSAYQGDYMPAAPFISEYILTVDGFWNLLLILAILPGIFLIQKRSEFIAFLLYLVLVFLTMEISSHILERHVLYGRTIRPFYLSALVFSTLILERILSSLRNKKIYVVGFGILISVICLNWLPRFIIFRNLIYPAQFKEQSREYLKARYGEFIVEEALFVNYFGINSPPKMKIFTEYKEAESGKFYIINANVIYPYFGSYDLNLFCKNEVLLKKPHVQYAFRPYLFEGHSKVMREQMDKDPLYYQLIFCKSIF